MIATMNRTSVKRTGSRLRMEYWMKHLTEIGGDIFSLGFEAICVPVTCDLNKSQELSKLGNLAKEAAKIFPNFSISVGRHFDLYGCSPYPIEFTNSGVSTKRKILIPIPVRKTVEDWPSLTLVQKSIQRVKEMADSNNYSSVGIPVFTGSLADDSFLCPDTPRQYRRPSTQYPGIELIRETIDAIVDERFFLVWPQEYYEEKCRKKAEYERDSEFSPGLD